MLPSESFAHRFPTPLAAAWRNTELTRSPAERLAHVIGAADVAVRLLVAILKSDCDRDQDVSRAVASSFGKLATASWGTWAEVATTMAKALRASRGAVTTPIVDTWLRPDGGAGPAQLAFRDLIPLRNESAHKGPALSEEAARKKEANVRTAAVAFLEALAPLADLMLFRTGAATLRRDGAFEAPWSVYRGTEEIVVPRQVTWTGHIDERRLHVWLPESGQALLVEPYLKVSPVASLNMDGLHLFSGLDRQGRLVLRHDRSGAEETVPAPARGDAHTSPIAITAGLSRESGVLPVADGRQIGGRYALGRRLRRGSVCDVYEGRDTKLGRLVAVKVLRDDVETKSDLAQRFERESEVLAGLDHPNIVRVLDHTFGDDGRPALILELVSGGSLRDRVGQASPEDVTRWMRDALSGLACAHEAGVIHRDLRPDNVLVGADGAARLADFDLAAIPNAQGSASLTRTRFGLVGYLAPELMTGAPVSPASDIYALGVTWDELLHGELRSRAELGVGLDADSRDFIVAMTSGSAEARPSAARLVARLMTRRVTNQTTGDTRVVSEAPTPTARPRRWFPWLVAVVMTAFLAVVGWALGSRYFGVGAEAAAPSRVATTVAPVTSPTASVEPVVLAKPGPTPAPPSAVEPAQAVAPPKTTPLELPTSAIARSPDPPSAEPPAPVRQATGSAPTAASGGAQAARGVIPLAAEPMVPVPKDMVAMDHSTASTIGRWRFDTLVMGVDGDGNKGVVGHYVMKTTGADGGSKMYLHQTFMTPKPSVPGERMKIGYLGNTSWPSSGTPIVSRCLEMKKGDELRDERWFLFRFDGDSVRGWWVSVNRQIGGGALRWGVLQGAREGALTPYPMYPTPSWAHAADVCARACLASSGESPCIGATPRLDACVAACLPEVE